MNLSYIIIKLVLNIRWIISVKLIINKCLIRVNIISDNIPVVSVYV